MRLHDAKNKGEVVAICCSRGWAMQFPCVYEKSRLEIPMAHNVPESEIRVKSYEHLNFMSASVVQFRATRFLMGLNRTSESKFMAI